MGCVEIVMSVIMVCVGICIGIRLLIAPIKIKFKVSFLDRVYLAYIMFAIISCAMMSELIANQVQLVKWQSATGFIKVLSELIDAGVLIAIMLPLLSILFSKWVRKFDLDLCEEYSENAVKVYYSLVIIVNCIFYLYIMDSSVTGDISVNQNVFGRVVIWLLNVFGTWVGIGFHCKGRIDKEIENVIRSKKTVDTKGLIKNMALFGSTFAFCCALLFLPLLVPETFNKLMLVFYVSMFSFVITMFFVVIIGACIMYPSAERSDRKLADMVNKMNNSDLGSIKARYQRLQYSLVEREGKKYVEVCRRDVQWLEHEKEIDEVFDVKPNEVEAFEYESCKEYLSGIIKKQRDFIKDKFEFCRNEKEKELKEKWKKYFR